MYHAPVAQLRWLGMKRHLSSGYSGKIAGFQSVTSCPSCYSNV